MEQPQNTLFQAGTPIGRTSRYGHPAETGPLLESIEPDSTRTAPVIDVHMTDLLSDYITRLPDNATRKYMARQLINFIIKSAGL